MGDERGTAGCRLTVIRGGTPVSRKQGLDEEPFRVTCKVRFVRYDVNQIRAEQCQVRPEWRGGFGG